MTQETRYKRAEIVDTLRQFEQFRLHHPCRSCDVI